MAKNKGRREGDGKACRDAVRKENAQGKERERQSKKVKRGGREREREKVIQTCSSSTAAIKENP